MAAELRSAACAAVSPARTIPAAITTFHEWFFISAPSCPSSPLPTRRRAGRSTAGAELEDGTKRTLGRCDNKGRPRALAVAGPEERSVDPRVGRGDDPLQPGCMV